MPTWQRLHRAPQPHRRHPLKDLYREQGPPADMEMRSELEAVRGRR